jgi:hypothetical protein
MPARPSREVETLYRRSDEVNPRKLNKKIQSLIENPDTPTFRAVIQSSIFS